MKIRTGFVSNSSSSSFIIGIGKVTKNKRSRFKEWYNKITLGNTFYEGEVNFLTSEEIFNKDVHDYIPDDIEYDYDKDELVVKAPVNSEPEIRMPFDPLDIDRDSEYFLVTLGNNEGDSAFYDYGSEELIYDKVDDDWFEEKQKKILDVLNSGDFFNDVRVKIGADRNG